MTAQHVKTLNLDLGSRSYEIIIGSGLLDQAGDYLGKILKRPKTVIITDENVARVQLPRLEAALKAANIEFTTLILPAGENTKSFTQLESLLDQLLSLRLERSDMIVAFGGGVIGDLVGFAASIYLRGIDFIQIPTTLLAQVDSSVGGKTGINSPRGKNLIGAFHQPRLVLIDTLCLETLDPRHVISGYAEVVKYAFINDRAFFDYLDANISDLSDENLSIRSGFRSEIILKSCAAKATVVGADEKEKGARALLNLGHTFGHALEADLAYSDRLFHGEAVAIGTEIAFELSQRLGLCSAEDCALVAAHHRKAGLKSADGFTFDSNKLIAHMQGDKKMEDGQITFILTKAIGEAFLYRGVNMSDIKDLLDDFFKA
jgi:3-dehydroquinate synthase